MQRKVNRSDSDYHYGKEKYKRNVGDAANLLI